MSSRVINDNCWNILQQTEELKQADQKSLQLLGEAAEIVELRQGQTLLRASCIESHAFLVIEGALRLLAKEPFNNELFSVGRVEVGQIVGIVGLLRQAPCEGAIARRPTKLISIPLELIAELIKTDTGLRKDLKVIGHHVKVQQYSTRI